MGKKQYSREYLKCIFPVPFKYTNVNGLDVRYLKTEETNNTAYL